MASGSFSPAFTNEEWFSRSIQVGGKKFSSLCKENKETARTGGGQSRIEKGRKNTIYALKRSALERRGKLRKRNALRPEWTIKEKNTGQRNSRGAGVEEERRSRK
jgi:hypothetical protein